MEMEQFKIEFGQRIKAKREEAKLTQTELANKVGYSENGKGIISKIENGKVEPPISKMFDFAKALNTNVLYLMGWEFVPPPDDKDTHMRAYMTDAEAMLLSMYRQLNENGQRAALNMLTGLTLDKNNLAPSDWSKFIGERP